MSKNQHTVTTDDLAMATFLNIEGMPHERLEMKDRRSAIWIFHGNGDLSELADEYQRGDALVEPLAFSRKLREVRDELYQFMNRHRERTPHH
jgi:hypothetical protein